MSATQWWVERAATGIELLAVAIIVATIAVATVVYLLRIVRSVADVATYRSYRQDVARALMLGLEILVAADKSKLKLISLRARPAVSAVRSVRGRRW
jgi:uncharacterized membrane protein